MSSWRARGDVLLAAGRLGASAYGAAILRELDEAAAAMFAARVVKQRSASWNPLAS